jgi:uncharacterized OB-fold protein
MANIFTIICKTCASCGEIMPRTETVCYCGGPIKLDRVAVEMRTKIASYKDRKWLYLFGDKK